MDILCQKHLPHMQMLPSMHVYTSEQRLCFGQSSHLLNPSGASWSFGKEIFMLLSKLMANERNYKMANEKNYKMAILNHCILLISNPRGLQFLSPGQISLSYGFSI